MVEETKAGYFSPVVTSDPFEITGATVSHDFSFTNTPFGSIKAEKINGFTSRRYRLADDAAVPEDQRRLG